ncbi:NfeD family protein [Luteimonas sp. A277]
MTITSRIGTRWLMCLWALAAALSVLVVSPAWAQEPATAGGGVLLVDIKGGIGPATRDHIRNGIERAASEDARALVLRIDTPGGLDAATRDINQDILASPVPVIAWVAPNGARAASAGTYIVYASHLAAMAPATSLGAATPVSIGGAPGGGRQSDDGDGDESDQNGDSADTQRGTGSASERKAVNDSVAYLRGLATLRGRDVAFAEEAVRDAATLTAGEALERGVVEVVAASLESLLEQADGREVTVAGETRTLAVAGRTVTELAPNWRVRLLSVLTDPTFAYMLLLVGMYGLLLEGYSPGAVLPGVVGAICLLLALYALQVLPVNYAGLALIALGIILMAVELATPSFGVLGIGGLVALVFGSVILFDHVPGFAVSNWLLAGIGIASGAGFMFMLWLAMRARRRPVGGGAEEMLGHEAVVAGSFEGRGQVRIRGELWQAASDAPLVAGQRVRVLSRKGLVLRVSPLDGGHPHEPINRSPEVMP